MEERASRQWPLNHQLGSQRARRQPRTPWLHPVPGKRGRGPGQIKRMPGASLPPWNAAPLYPL
eukprot:3707837-Lingulodinium_polyedra.AAC.1